jgi:hypothetical protein
MALMCRLSIARDSILWEYLILAEGMNYLSR